MVILRDDRLDTRRSAGERSSETLSPSGSTGTARADSRCWAQPSFRAAEHGDLIHSVSRRAIQGIAKSAESEFIRAAYRLADLPRLVRGSDQGSSPAISASREMVEGMQNAREPHLLSLRIERAACANFANLCVLRSVSEDIC